MNTKVYKNIRNIPTLPTVLAQIFATLDNPDSSARDLEKIIRNDQALTTKLLAVANSAFYGFRHEISTVSRAVVAIGYSEVRNLCLGIGLMGFMASGKFHDPEHAQSLWLHSLATAEASKVVSNWTGGVDIEVAFTAGLLHDIGKVVLSAFYPDEMLQLKELMDRGNNSLTEAERELDIGHEEVGKAIAEHWELPPVLIEVIGKHHHLHKRLAYLPMTATVQVADYLTRRMGMGDPMRLEPVDISKVALSTLGISEQTLNQCLEDLEGRRDEITALWERLTSALPG